MNGSKIMDSLFYNGLQSPELNPIEHLWEHIKRRLGEYETPPSGMLELWERVEAKWNKIPAKVCQNLIDSMPRMYSKRKVSILNTDNIQFSALDSSATKPYK